MIHEEPYQGLTCSEPFRDGRVPFEKKGAETQVVHGCRQLVPWGVELSLWTSATLVFCYHSFENSKETAGVNRRKERMTSSQHAPYILGYTRNTMAKTIGGEPVRGSKSSKLRLSSDWSLQLDFMKPESLVIASQLYGGEYVLQICTHRPSHAGSRLVPKTGCEPFSKGCECQRLGRWLIWSRNKVPVLEGAGGEPLFFFFPKNLGFFFQKSKKVFLFSHFSSLIFGDKAREPKKKMSFLLLQKPKAKSQKLKAKIPFGFWTRRSGPLAQLVRAFAW